MGLSIRTIGIARATSPIMEHPRPLNQQRLKSRRNIRSFKCRFTIASITRTGWLNYREPLRELSDANVAARQETKW